MPRKKRERQAVRDKYVGVGEAIRLNQTKSNQIKPNQTCFVIRNSVFPIRNAMKKTVTNSTLWGSAGEDAGVEYVEADVPVACAQGASGLDDRQTLCVPVIETTISNPTQQRRR